MPEKAFGGKLAKTKHEQDFHAMVSIARLALVVLATLLWMSGLVPASAQTTAIPAWLERHVGAGEGQIAPVVLERARALYQQKKREGAVRNPCYLAMDATRPSTSSNGAPGKRLNGNTDSLTAQ